MNVYRNARIATKLYSAFALVLSFTVLLAIFAISRVNAIDTALEDASTLRRTQLDPLFEAREALDQTGISARNAFIFEDKAAAIQELDLLDKYKAEYLAVLDRLDPLMRGNQQYDLVRTELLQMARELERPRRYLDAGDMAGFGTFLTTECTPLRRRIVADIAVLLQDLTKINANATAAASVQATNASYWIGALSAASALLCMVIGAVIVRSLLRQLGGEPAYAASVARAIARGELHRQVDTGRAHGSSLLAAMRTMRDSLSGIVANVRGGTDAIASASAQIASGNLDLSNRTEAQGAALAQVASSMKQLIASVRENAGHAEEASELSQQAATVSRQGGEAVEGIVSTMNLINESSKKIVDIISVIDGIAFQTNILALNAAVEAARAGEQGRGFAVVATEVRNLAHRSAAAAKEVKALIEDSVSKVGIGTAQVSAAGTTMTTVVDGIARVTLIMRDIANVSRTQSADIDSVDAAISQLDDMTLQNAALVEQATAAAQSLQTQANQLAGVVHTFQLEARAA